MGHNPYASHKHFGPQIGVQKKQLGKNPFHLPVVHSSHYNPGIFSLKKDALPPIHMKPFTGVSSNVNFIDKNRNAAKHLTKSQSQARMLDCKNEG